MPSSYKGVEGITEYAIFEYYFDRLDTATTLINMGKQNNRGVLHVNVPLKAFKADGISQITDGTSSTIVVGEYTTKTGDSHRAFWAYAYWEWSLSSVSLDRPWTLLPDYDECAAIDQAHGGGGNHSTCKRGWSSLHSGGINFLFCDGSVKLLNRNINMNTLGGLATIAGGELLGDY
jgi:prepilin-type processing-associated H-X9-DG protein